MSMFNMNISLLFYKGVLYLSCFVKDFAMKYIVYTFKIRKTIICTSGMLFAELHSAVYNKQY